MAVKKVSKLNQTVKVPVDANVLLTITIGNAQIGGSVVRWKSNPNILAKGEVTNLNLGLGMDIKGRTLRVTTNVLDVNEATNGIVINHFFNGCKPSLFPYSDRVNADGDIYQLITEYTFN